MENELEITQLEQEEIIKARKNTTNKKEDQRFRAIELKAKGLSTPEIAEKIDVDKRTIYRWLSVFKSHGISGLKNKKRPGNHRNISFEEEQIFLKQFEEKAQRGEIVEVKEIKNEYIKLVGHKIGNGQIYKVLKRHGWRKIMPRSKHPKKASEGVIETSKKLSLQ